VVTPTLDGDVLKILGRADAEFTPPQVHRLLGNRSVDGVRKALDRLAEQGIVQKRQAGQAFLYSLNRRHLGAAAVVALAEMFTTFIERLQQMIAAWRTPCVYAALLGSAARGEMRVDSDIACSGKGPQGGCSPSGAEGQSLRYTSRNPAHLEGPSRIQQPQIHTYRTEASGQRLV